MTTILVKNGTAVEGQSKCASCSYAHILRGYRESEEVVYCNFPNDLLLVPFKVYECSNYWDKNRPSWEQMQKLAIDVLPTSSAKKAGFRDSAALNGAAEELAVEAETVSA